MKTYELTIAGLLEYGITNRPLMRRSRPTNA